MYCYSACLFIIFNLHNGRVFATRSAGPLPPSQFRYPHAVAELAFEKWTYVEELWYVPSDPSNGIPSSAISAHSSSLLYAS